MHDNLIGLVRTLQLMSKRSFGDPDILSEVESLLELLEKKIEDTTYVKFPLTMFFFTTWLVTCEVTTFNVHVLIFTFFLDFFGSSFADYKQEVLSGRLDWYLLNK